MSQTTAGLQSKVDQSSSIPGHIEADTIVTEVMDEVKENTLDVAGRKEENKLSFLMKLLHIDPEKILNTVKGLLKQSAADKFKEFLEYLSTHQVWSFVLFAAVIFIGFPVFAFGGLGIISMLVTFGGFLLVEGALVLMGAAVMGGPILMIFGFVFSILFGISLVVHVLQKFGILKQTQVNQLLN